MRVLLVDDHPLVRQGIKSILLTDDKYSDVYEASDFDQGISYIKNLRPDIVLVDLYMKGKNGLELINHSKQSYPTIKYVVLTSSVKRQDYAKAKSIGVDGYILKSAYPEDIIYGLNTIQRGKTYIDSGVLMIDDDYSKVNLLSKREMEVYDELVKGNSNKSIAKELFISESTVKKHVSNILYKLGFNQRMELIINANKVV